MQNDQAIMALEKAIGYKFNDPNLLLEAITHSSAVPALSEGTAGSVRWNERLEFLGDAVLGHIVSALLMEKLPDAQEGVLSKMRGALVSTKTLTQIATEINLGEALILGVGEEKNGGRAKASLLADGLEALIAAVYLDGGFDKATDVTAELFDNFMASDTSMQWVLDDYKTALQEYTQEHYKTTPDYEVVKEHGPDHEKTFKVAVKLGEKTLGIGTGHSKKSAAQQAARRAMTALAEGDDT